MSDINEARVTGRVAQPPRINKTQRGFEIGHVTLEVHETKYTQNQDGSRTGADIIALYQSVKVVGLAALEALKSCMPGDVVYAEGKLLYTSFNDPNGGKHEDKEIEARKFHKIHQVQQYSGNTAPMPQQPARMTSQPQYAVPQTAPVPRQLSEVEEYAMEQYRRGTAPAQQRPQQAVPEPGTPF